MSLSEFSVIVAIDGGNGIAKNGDLPWNSRSDMKFFRETTMGRGRNAVIMGRVTYESIPVEFRPLENRHCVVVSRIWRQEEHPEITVCSSLTDALISIGSNMKSFDDVFVCGGEQIYKDVIDNFLYLCKRIYVTRFKTDYECTQFFPWDTVKNFHRFKDDQKTRDFVRYYLKPVVKHEEYQYLNALRNVKENGEMKMDRTGTGTTSLFGLKMEFDISEQFPILTTKKVNYEIIFKELLFFLSGKTNTKILEEQNVNIWKGNTSREYLDSVNLDEYEEGDMGPGYGFQWRHWGAEYEGCERNYTGEGVDQISNLISGLRDNPHDRRHIISAWNVMDIPKMALPPCHMIAQFNVSGDRKHLDCQLYQRSADMFLGVPFNITSYAALTYMLAHITGLKPRKFIHVIGDAHIYNNHAEQVNRQISRTPKPFPTLNFRKKMKLREIDDFNLDSFIIERYDSWATISAKMAV